MHQTEDQNKAAAELLEKRLRLLLDVKAAETGAEPSFSEIAAFFERARYEPVAIPLDLHDQRAPKSR